MLAKFGRSISEMKRISPPPPPPSPVNPLADAQSACSVTTLRPSAESDVTPLEYRRPDLHLSRPPVMLVMRYVCRCSSRPTSTTTGSCRRASSATSSPSRPTSSPLSTSESKKKDRMRSLRLRSHRPQERGGRGAPLRCSAQSTRRNVT